MAELFDLSDPLSAFLQEATAKSFAYGTWDCGYLCADWFLRRRGVDPGRQWRGRYSTEIGLARLLKRRGGIVAHFDAALLEAGAKRTDDPERGDIAIVEAREGLTGGIVTGVCIALVAPRGVIVRHRSLAPLQAAWSI